MADDLYLGLTTAAWLFSPEEGSRFLELLQRLAPDLTPEKFGNWEPLSQKFEELPLEEVLKSWKWPFLWTKRKGLVRGSVWPSISKLPQQGEINLSMRHGRVSPTSLSALLSAWAEAFLADFGLFHLLTQREKEVGFQAKAVSFTSQSWKGATLSVPAIRLREQYVPDLYWLTLFGPPYVKIFGRERLLSAPAHRVDELPYGGVLLQLTPEITDIETNYFTFLSARNRVKEHLNHDVFFDPKKGADYAYRRPGFVNR